MVDIHDGQSINIGNAGGPQLTFEIGAHRGKGGGIPAAQFPPPAQARRRPGQRRGTSRSGAGTASRAAARCAPTRGDRAHRQRPSPRGGPAAGPAAPPLSPSEYPTTVQAGRPPGPPPDEVTVVNARPAPAPHTCRPPKSPGATSAWPRERTRHPFRQAPRAECDTVRQAGRLGHDRPGSDNGIVVPDVLASRYHATLTLTPLDPEIHDTSVNGTFVNGTRVGSAILSEGDVVTVGNIDLVVGGGLLVRRSETEPPPRPRPGSTQCPVRRRERQTASHRLLADRATRNVTAVIGGSGAGKSTLARLIAATRRPAPAQSRSRVTTFTPNTPRYAAGSAWFHRTMWCTVS